MSVRPGITVCLWMLNVVLWVAIGTAWLDTNARCRGHSFDGAAIHLMGYPTCYRLGLYDDAVRLEVPLWYLDDGWDFRLFSTKLEYPGEKPKAARFRGENF